MTKIDGDIASIYSTHRNFLAVRKSDGKCFFWGKAMRDRIEADLYLESQKLHGNIREVYPGSDDEFILVRNSDGALLVFDHMHSIWGMDKIPTRVQTLLKNDLKTIYCTRFYYFAIQNSTGKLVVWSHKSCPYKFDSLEGFF